MFLRVLQRALMEAVDTIPEGYGEVVVGLVTGGMSLIDVYNTFPTLCGPATIWTRLDSAISHMAPTVDEMSAVYKSPSRPDWDRTAFRALTEATHMLDKRRHETPTPP